MTQTSDLMRKYTDIVMEGPYDSKAAVTANDARRVQVAPNVQNKVLQYDQDQAETDRINSRVRRMDHPTATKVGDTIGGAIGDVVAGGRAAWDAGVNAFNTRNTPMPDPKKPVDVIPDPPRGTSTPRLPGQGQGGSAGPSRRAPQAGTPVAPATMGANEPRQDPATSGTYIPADQMSPADRENFFAQQRASNERQREYDMANSKKSMDQTMPDEPATKPSGQKFDVMSKEMKETRTVDLLRRLSDIVIEAEVKEVKTAKKTQDNVHKSSNDMMKPYKQ